MTGLKDVGEWVGKHPYTTGAVVLVGGLGLILLLSPKGGSSDSGSNDAATSAYFQAEAATAASGNQLQETQIAAQASTAQTLINANANENINSTWAAADVTQTLNTNAAQVQLAPFAAQESEVSAITQGITATANAPPLTSTSTKQGGGFNFLGIFSAKGPDKTTTTQSANPAAVAGETELSNLLSGVLNGQPAQDNSFISAH